VKKLAAGLALVGLALFPCAGQAWVSERFQSPSGNIRCYYRSYEASITCSTNVPRRSVTLYEDGYTTRTRGRGVLPRMGPVLQYWRGAISFDGWTSCWSGTDGMQCENGSGGFHIAREGISTW
jgi:hypothetical protein